MVLLNIVIERQPLGFKKRNYVSVSINRNITHVASFCKNRRGKRLGAYL